MRSWVLLLAAFIQTSRAIPVDNGVEGEPEIECGPTSITINLNTRNPFEGHVYVKGLFEMEGCRSDEGGRQVAGIELPFDQCNVGRTRSLNPKGVFVTTTVVIQFHPQFVTKVDRAYRIQCFYMEADKTVSTQIEVSELTTAFQTQVVPMPICRYEILEGGPSGQPIQFATIGQQVYHKWTCDSETVDTFCAVVHSCFVDDGNGDKVEILNMEGCALDKFLLNNLEYPTDLMAGQEAHVYKYADRAQLFYQCQISITIKEPHAECARPQCTEPTGFGAISAKPLAHGKSAPHSNDTKSASPRPAGAHRAAGAGQPAAAPPAAGGAAHPAASGTATTRAHAAGAGAGTTRAHPGVRLLRKRNIINYENTMDVRTDINTIDITDQASIPEALRQRMANEPRTVILSSISRSGVCLSPFGFSVMMAFGAAFLSAIVAIGAFMLRSRNDKEFGA
jgi:hypothetical protein